MADSRDTQMLFSNLEFTPILESPITGDASDFRAAADEAYPEALASATDQPPDVLFNDIVHDRHVGITPGANSAMKILAKFFLEITKLKIAICKAQKEKDKVREMDAPVTAVREYVADNPPDAPPRNTERCSPLSKNLLAIIKIQDSETSTDLDGKLLCLFVRVSSTLEKYNKTSNSNHITASTELILTA